jgi:transcriptional regulator with XRE-family HTH domain
MRSAMPFSDRLKALRTRRGFSQEALARAADVSTATVARLEHAGLDPSWSTVVKLARALGVGPSDFLDEEPAAGVTAAAKKSRRKG